MKKNAKRDQPRPLCVHLVTHGNPVAPSRACAVGGKFSPRRRRLNEPDRKGFVLSFFFFGSENKREQFRRYLERAGVLDSLTNVLVALYEETDKPEDPLEFIKTHFGVAHAEAETLRLEISELQQKCEVLSRDNEDLRNRLLQYEPAPEDEGKK
uniref:c-Myc-binding protein n=1 Tax=Denticeps clupeoides TaxID=299321 RepID=A0AAY4DUB8_9TELE